MPPAPPPSRMPLLITLLVPLTLLTAAPPARPRSGGWSLAPLGGGRPAFCAEGAPGAVLQDTVAVTNRGRTPLTVRLRGTGVPAALARAARAALTVPARTRAEVPLTVTVPRGAAPGDHTGAILARDAYGRTATAPVRLRVGGPAPAALTVEHLAVHTGRITYEPVDRGTTVLVPTLAVRADGLFGPLLPPGTRRAHTEPWPGRPALDEVRVRLTVTAPGGAHDSGSTWATYVPWSAPAGTAGGAAAVTAVIRRRRRGDRHRSAGEPTGAVS